MKANVLFMLITFGCFAQGSLKRIETKDITAFSLWAFKQEKLQVNGLSLGVASFLDNEIPSNTNGLKIELIGKGLFVPLIPKSPILEDQSLVLDYKRTYGVEKVNGMSLSGSGSACDCLINGISTGLIGQINYEVNGFSASLLMNFAQIHNGIQVAMFNETHYTRGLQTGLFNSNYKMNGVQIGLVNFSDELKGFQFGLLNTSKNIKGLQFGLFNTNKNRRGLQLGFWNTNSKRSFPFLNF